MKASTLGRDALGICGSIAFFAACSGAGSQLASAPPPQSAGAGDTLPIHPIPDASRNGPSFHIENDLLYISDTGSDDVYVYTYPRHKYVGAITGFYPPLGMCSDSKGNVWVADPNYADLVKFAHGGKKIIATLNDPNEYPVGCAIDEKTGDLAAVNGTSASGGTGSVSVYKGARGSPRVIAAFQTTYFDGYDNNGNLFVDGVDATGSALGKVAKGGSAVQRLTVQGATINVPGAIQYVFGNLAVGDQDLNGTNSGIYQFAVSGLTATATGTVQLLGSQRIGPFYILKNTHRVICGDTIYGYIRIYNYPAGGKPIKNLRLLPTGTLSGFALSVPTPSPSP